MRFSEAAAGMKLTVALLALLLAPVSSSFLPKDSAKDASKAVHVNASEQSPHVVPVPSKPSVKLPIPHGHPEAHGVKNPKPVEVAEKVAAVSAKLGLAAPKPAAKEEAKPVVKVESKPVEAPKPAAKVEAKPVAAVPVPSKPTTKLPIPHGHPEAHGVKNPNPLPVAAKVAAVSAKLGLPTSQPAAKAAAKVVTKPVVPKAAVVVAVAHAQIKAEAKPVKKLTTHDHAVSAQKSADEAQQHLEKAKKAFEKTKVNVKETLKVGKKIEGTADKIDTLYEAPKKPKAPAAPVKESAARSVAVPTLVAMLVAAVASC